jgi:hypothetical protein
VPPTKKPWLPDETLRGFYNLGWRNADIAHANGQATGWQPHPSMVSRKFAELGLPPRRASHRDLIRQEIRPEHRRDPIYRGLMAIDSQRKGHRVARAERSRAEWLRDILTHRGVRMVTVYFPDLGWFFAIANKTDIDIHRNPIEEQAPAHDSAPVSGCESSG